MEASPQMGRRQGQSAAFHDEFNRLRAIIVQIELLPSPADGILKTACGEVTADGDLFADEPTLFIRSSDGENYAFTPDRIVNQSRAVATHSPEDLLRAAEEALGIGGNLRTETI